MNSLKQTFNKLTVLIVLFIFKILSVESLTYCELEQKCRVPHIACNQSGTFDIFSITWSGFKPSYFTFNQKNLLLRRINSLKNRIAQGHLSDEGFPSATGFTIINWNNEFEFLANLSVYKIPYFIDACTLTNDSRSTYMLYYEDWSDDLTESQFFDDALGSMIHEIRTDTPQWLASYFATTTRIGCAYTEFYGAGIDEDDYRRLHHVWRMRCVLDDSGYYTGKIYETGIPCTNCPSNMSCDVRYTALCSAQNNTITHN